MFFASKRLLLNLVLEEQSTTLGVMRGSDWGPGPVGDWFLSRSENASAFLGPEPRRRIARQSDQRFGRYTAAIATTEPKYGQTVHDPGFMIGMNTLRYEVEWAIHNGTLLVAGQCAGARARIRR